MIRIFSHYLHRQTLLQVFFDLGLIVFAVVAVVLSQEEAASSVIPFVALMVCPWLVACLSSTRPVVCTSMCTTAR